MNWKTFDEVPPFKVKVLLGSAKYFTGAYLAVVDEKGMYFIFDDKIQGADITQTAFTHWCEVELPKE